MSDVARARAMRFAFLVEATPDSQPVLDAIFRTCYGLYGGRFAVIVPCSEGRISDAYWQFLEAADPDVVYSYVQLSDELQSLVHERLYPAYLIEHWRSPLIRPDDSSAYLPRLPFQPLSSLSAIPQVARGDVFRTAANPFLIDGWQGQRVSDFVHDNFGSRTASTGGWSRYQVDTNLMRPLSFAATESFRDPRLRPAPDDSYFENDIGLLERLAKEKIVGVAQLSAFEVRRRDYRDPRWTEVATLFVGDGFNTRLAFWNARHLMPGWLDGQLVSWRVSPTSIADDGFTAALLEVLKRYSHVQSSGGGPPHIRVITVMDDCRDEDAITRRLQDMTRWCRFTGLHLTSLDECAPSRESAENAHELEGGHFPIGSGTPWQVMTRVDSRILPPAVAPQHMQYVPSEQRHLRQGYFAVDCDLLRTRNLSMCSNVQDRWRLPRRLRTADAFIRSTSEPTLHARANRDGLLTIFGTVDAIPYALTEPDDDTAFEVALTRGAPWPLHRGQEQHRPEQIAMVVEPSDCGKALSGVMHKFEGLHRAQKYLLHKFWSKEFAELGATVTIHRRMVDDLANKFEKHSRNSPVWDLRDDQKRRWLAEWALREARREQRANRYRRYDTLLQSYRGFWQEYALKHPSAGDDEDAADENARNKRDLDRSLQYLCRREVMHQGHEWRCPNCLHRNWISIDHLARELICVVCGRSMPAPVDGPWQFRLNEFVHRSIREQGILPVLWALYTLQNQSMGQPMYFLGPTTMYFDYESFDSRAPNAEVDLLVVRGTEVILVEAKSSSRDVRPDQIAASATRIRPNRVVLAVMESRSAALEAQVAEIGERLAGIPSNVELIATDDADGDDHPSLPAGPGEGTMRFRMSFGNY